MEMGLGPGHIVLDDPTPLPKKGAEPSNFRPIFSERELTFTTRSPFAVARPSVVCNVRAPILRRFKFSAIFLRYDTIRYDTMIFTGAQYSQLNLPHGTKQKRIMKKLKITRVQQ